jgi:hypothetical protein
MSAKKADDIAALKQAETEAADIVRAAREGLSPFSSRAISCQWPYLQLWHAHASSSSY